MRWLLLALATCGLAAAQQCPPGYALEGFNTCFSQTIFDGPHYLAYKNCAKDNAFMFEIQNAFQNTQVQSMAKGKTSLWLGLMCLGNSSATCKWDTGNDIIKNNYENFAKGMPNADIGACVYMDVKSGLWYSSDCTKTVASSICEYTQGITIDYCRDKSLFFQGKCYQAYAGAVSAAWATCKNYRAGGFASIHSAGENSFVRDVSILLGRSSYAYIPLYYNNKTGYNWVDGSEFSYNNFGFENVSTSSGVAMALYDGQVQRGQWLFLTLPDKGFVTFVCETYPDHRQLPPTSAPPVCPGTNSYNTDAVVTSPGYPQPSVATECEYVITALPHGTQQGGHVSLFFTDISLDARSTITLYNDLNNQPIVLNSTNYQPKTFYSFDSTLKLVFKTSGGAKNFFRAETVSGETTVEPEPSANCNGGTFYGSYGEVTSPNYPKPYPPNVNNCEYHIHSSADRLVLNVEAYLNETDTITVIDGNGVKLTFPQGEDSISGGPHVNITLTSYTDTVKIVFQSSATGTKNYGFWVLFNSVY